MANIRKRTRKYSRPALRKMLVVNSEASLDAVESYVKPTMSAIYALDVILFYIGSEEVAKQANEKMTEMLEKKLAVFDEEIQKLQAKVNEHCGEDIEYTQQRSEEYMIYSPLCATYLKLIKKFELNTNLIDQLWLNAEITSAVRNTKVRKLGRHLRNVSREINNASRQAMSIARNEGKEAEVKESIKELGVDSQTSEAILDVTAQALESDNEPDPMEETAA